MNDVSTTPQPDRTALDEFLGTPPSRPWYRRRAYIGAAVGLLVLLFLLSRCFGGSETASYASAPVERGNLTVTVSATGNLLPTNQVEVGSEQSGIVNDVYVDNNDRVVRGQPLARLDTSRLRDTIVQNQAGMAAAQAQVAQAQASAVQAHANLSRLEEVYRLSAGKVPSKTELDTGRAENQRTQAGVRAAQAQVAQARAQLSSAQTNLSKATIYSPVNGVVLSRQIDPGQTVAASFQAPVLFTIAEDLSQMRLDVKVDEADVGQVHERQRATFTVDAYPGRSFAATITRVDVGANASDSGASSASSSSNVVAYTAVLAVANPDLALRPGMTATAEIVTSEQRNVLLVPNAALRFSPERDAAAAARQQSQGGITSVIAPQRPRFGRNREGDSASIGRGSRQTVYLLDADGQPQPVQVMVGATNGTLTEVISGKLKPGDKVITGKLAAEGSSGNSGGFGGNRQNSGGFGGGRQGGGGGGGAGGGPRSLLLPFAVAALPGRRRRHGARADG